MQNATIRSKRESPRSDPGSTHVPDLFDGLRDVFHQLRRSGPGDHSDKAAVALLAHLKSLGPVRASDLAERACLAPSTVSRHLKELEDAGYLLRSPDPDDKRATVVEVSLAGNKLVAKTIAQRIEVLEKAVRSWSAADVTALTKLTRRLAAELEQL